MKKNYVVILILSIFIYLLSSMSLYFLAANTTTAHLDIDSVGYDIIARHFCDTNILCDPALPEQIPVTALGYPLFLGVIYKIFGTSYLNVILIQILFSLLACFLLYRISYMLFDEKTAIATVFLFSINLGFLVYCQFILTEILLSTLLILGLERLITYFKNKNLYILMQSGVVYGVSIMVKPVALFYIVIPFFFIALFTYKNYLNVFKHIILFGIAFYLPVLFYMFHNKTVFDVFMVSPAMHENLYNYFLPKVIMNIEGKTKQEALEKITETYEGKINNDSRRWINARSLLFKFIKNNLIIVSYIWLNNVFKTFCGLYSSQLKFLVNPSLKGTETSFFSKKGSLINRINSYLTDGTNNFLVHFIALLQLILIIIQYLLVIVAGIVLLFQKRYFLFSFIVVSIFYFAFITGHEGFARYRMMFEYFFILFEAFGMVFIYQVVFKNKKVVQYQLTY